MLLLLLEIACNENKSQDSQPHTSDTSTQTEAPAWCPDSTIPALTEEQWASIFYVDVNAANGGDGTLEHPYNSITKAVEQAKATGTRTVFANAGVYLEGVELEDLSDFTLVGCGSEQTLMQQATGFGEAPLFGSVIYVSNAENFQVIGFGFSGYLGVDDDHSGVMVVEGSTGNVTDVDIDASNTFNGFKTERESDVTLSDVAIQDGFFGIVAEESSVDAYDIRVTDQRWVGARILNASLSLETSTLENIAGVGISASEGSYVTLVNSEISHIGGLAAVQAFDSSFFMSGSTITDVNYSTTNGGDGVVATGSEEDSVSVDIVNSVIDTVGRAPIVIDNGSLTTLNEVTVTNSPWLNDPENDKNNIYVQNDTTVAPGIDVSLYTQVVAGDEITITPDYIE